MQKLRQEIGNLHEQMVALSNKAKTSKEALVLKKTQNTKL